MERETLEVSAETQTRLIAGYDQLGAALTQVARTAATYYEKLKKYGIPADVAKTLVTDWHLCHIESWTSDGDDGDGDLPLKYPLEHR